LGRFAAVHLPWARRAIPLHGWPASRCQPLHQKYDVANFVFRNRDCEDFSLSSRVDCLLGLFARVVRALAFDAAKNLFLLKKSSIEGTISSNQFDHEIAISITVIRKSNASIRAQTPAATRSLLQFQRSWHCDLRATQAK
jgi:hypothetical protein